MSNKVDGLEKTHQEYDTFFTFVPNSCFRQDCKEELGIFTTCICMEGIHQMNGHAQASLLQKYESIVIYNERYLELVKNIHASTSYYQGREFSLRSLMRNTEDDVVQFQTEASEEQKLDPLFVIVTSTYPREQFALFLINQVSLTADDVKKLIKLNGMMRNHVTRHDWLFRTISGAIAAGALLLLNQFPKEIFDYYRLNYVYFRMAVASISILAFILFCIVTISFYFPLRKLRREYNELEYILSWCSIFTEGESAKVTY